MRIIALIPAHNEEVGLPGLLRSLRAQTTPINQIIVVSDNSTDRTNTIAKEWGVSLFETIQNSQKKAGALNQVLGQLIPTLEDEDLIFVVDADGVIAPSFITSALSTLRDPEVGAIGGVFTAPQASSLFTKLQANEYTRYARQIIRRGETAMVLSGTSTLVRVMALRQVYTARQDSWLPGHGYYDGTALCEDFELTLALRSLGWRCLSPHACSVQTDVMPTLATLWRQRARWQRGTIESLYCYGYNTLTSSYILQQIELLIGTLAFLLTVLFTGWAVLHGTAEWGTTWKIVGLLFYVEHVWTVRKGGWRNVLLAATFFPELCYMVLLRSNTCWTYFQALRRTEQHWGMMSIDKEQHV